MSVTQTIRCSLAGVVLLAACRDSTPPEPPAPDAATHIDVSAVDVTRVDEQRPLDVARTDAAVDALPPPSWTDPAWRLPSHPIDTAERELCDDFSFVTPFWPDNAMGFCPFEDSLYINASGLTARVNLSTLDTAEVLSSAWTVPEAGFLRVAPHALYVAVVDRPRHTALLRLERSDGPAEVVVNGFNGQTYSPGSSLGFYDLAVTDNFIAWIFLGEDPSPALYVAGSHGENRRLIATGFPYHLQAQGDRLVWANGGDVWMYTATTGLVENLTHDAAAQWNPWVHDDLVVWLDQRDTPGPYSHSNPNNPEVYAMNLRDRVPIRITHDPPEHPVYQRDVSTDGRWIIYRDFRHNALPNEDAEDGVSEVYGVRVGTDVEVPLLTGSHALGPPVLIGDQLYVSCGRAGHITDIRQDIGVYRKLMPR